MDSLICNGDPRVTGDHHLSDQESQMPTSGKGNDELQKNNAKPSCVMLLR